MKLYKIIMLIWPLSILISAMVICKFTVAEVQEGRETEPSDIPINGYEEKLEDEKKILRGLKRLLELKESQVLPDRITTSELVTENENLSISKETSKYGAALYSINAYLIPINEILDTLASTSGRKLIIDEDIDNGEMFSVTSVFLEHNPLVDIVDIILGAKGLESIISDDIIFVTIPAKLEVVSSYEYYQGKAVQAYQRAMIKYPDYKGIARAYYELGNFYFSSGFPTIALQEFSVIVQNYPQDPLAKTSLFFIGKCFELLDNIEKARLTYQSYVNKYPLNSNVVNTYLTIGDLWRKQKKYKEAIETYKKIVKEFSKDNIAKSALMRLGHTYIESKDYDSALKTFSKMKKIHLGEEFRYEIEYQIGNCYYLMFKYTDAIDVLSQFVLYEKENDMIDDAYYKLADCFYKLEDYLMAYHLYKDALEKFPDSDLSTYGFLYKGKTLRLMSMLESAKNTFRDGLGRYPDSTHSESMKFEIGLCYFEDGVFNRAFEVFKEIDTEKESLDMAVHQAKIYAGICLSRERHHKEALEYYIRALGEKDITRQERKWIFKLMGDSYTELGELALATKVYQGEIL